MNIKRSTHIPNILFDMLLPHLSISELRLILVILRQTNGWIDQKTGKRKTRDWITHGQFVTKTGLTRQTVSSTLDGLSQKGIVRISDYSNNHLKTAKERQGKTKLFYAINDLEHVGLSNATCKVIHSQHVGLSVHNKTNLTKEKKTKGLRSIQSILKGLYWWK